jgi:hypothetical protein
MLSGLSQLLALTVQPARASAAMDRWKVEASNKDCKPGCIRGYHMGACVWLWQECVLFDICILHRVTHQTWCLPDISTIAKRLHCNQSRVSGTHRRNVNPPGSWEGIRASQADFETAPCHSGPHVSCSLSFVTHWPDTLAGSLRA